MLENVWLFLLGVAHIALATAVGAGFSARVREVYIVSAAFLGLVLFSVAAVASANVEVVTNTGEVVHRAQPAAGWYSWGMASISLIVAVAATLVGLQEVELTNA